MSIGTAHGIKKKQKFRHRNRIPRGQFSGPVLAGRRPTRQEGRRGAGSSGFSRRMRPSLRLRKADARRDAHRHSGPNTKTPRAEGRGARRAGLGSDSRRYAALRSSSARLFDASHQPAQAPRPPDPSLRDVPRASRIFEPVRRTPTQRGEIRFLADGTLVARNAEIGGERRSLRCLRIFLLSARNAGCRSVETGAADRRISLRQPLQRHGVCLRHGRLVLTGPTAASFITFETRPEEPRAERRGDPAGNGVNDQRRRHG